MSSFHFFFTIISWRVFSVLQAVQAVAPPRWFLNSDTWPLTHAMFIGGVGARLRMQVCSKQLVRMGQTVASDRARIRRNGSLLKVRSWRPVNCPHLTVHTSKHCTLGVWDSCLACVSVKSQCLSSWPLVLCRVVDAADPIPIPIDGRRDSCSWENANPPPSTRMETTMRRVLAGRGPKMASDRCIDRPRVTSCQCMNRNSRRFAMEWK